MSKNQVIKTIYPNPEIEIMHILMECQLLDESVPGNHQPGHHKQGPEEEEDAGAKRGFFSESVGYTSETLWED